MSQKIDKINLPKFKIEDYDLQQILGMGTFSRVRLAKNVKTNNFAAIKIFKKQEIIQEKIAQHISKEAKVLSLIDFPFIVKFNGFCQNDTYLYFLFELVQGGELYSYIREKVILEIEESIFYAGQVVLIFQYLHGLNIIYRDLKPENLLIGLDGYLKLCDFGFAKQCLTGKSLSRLGTPNYIAPEILLSKGHGKAADWWTLGVLIYEMIAGIDPFNSDDPMVMYTSILECKLKYPVNFDREAKSLVDHLLQLDVNKRYGNLKKGIKDIINHRWFDNLDWDYLMKKKLIPIYVPSVQSASDTTYFTDYPESNDNPASVSKKEDPFCEW